MEVPNRNLLQAIDLALAGDWDAAHQLVQQYEGDATAAWIHAVLHKIEGDPGNAGYWYRRANRLNHVSDDPRAELAAIQAQLTTVEYRPASTGANTAADHGLPRRSKAKAGP